MTRQRHFKITLYDKHLQRTGFVNDYISCVANPKHLAAGQTVFTVPTSHRNLGKLLDPGARAVVEFQGEHLMSGYLVDPQYTLPERNGIATLTIVDDLNVYWRMLGWPVPGADLLSQGTKQDLRTGPAETVAKGFLSAQLQHNTVDPITVAPLPGGGGRGSTITIGIRMTPLADQLMTALDTAGVGLTARQVGTRIVVDAYTPRVFPHVLSEAAGTVLSGTITRKDPTSTRTIIGGPNENTSREFRQRKTDALEAEYGYTVETFTDARSAESHADMDAAGDATLADGVTKAGISLTLSDSAIFTYGGTHGVHVGDQVQVRVGAGAVLTSVLREATLSDTRDEGLAVTPSIGEVTDSPDRACVSLLKDAFRALRELRTR